MYRHIGDEQTAEDLSQEVLNRVYTVRKTYAPGARFRTWLYRIARNLSLNRLRYEAYRETASLDDTAGDETPALRSVIADGREPAPSDRLERKELCDRVRAAVLGLPENQRTAVLLLRFEEMSYEQISDAMEITVQATKSLLNRAKENLRRVLAPEIADRIAIDGRSLARKG